VCVTAARTHPDDELGLDRLIPDDHNSELKVKRNPVLLVMPTELAVEDARPFCGLARWLVAEQTQLFFDLCVRRAFSYRQRGPLVGLDEEPIDECSRHVLCRLTLGAPSEECDTGPAEQEY
jgi:hypothetical protein